MFHEYVVRLLGVFTIVLMAEGHKQITAFKELLLPGLSRCGLIALLVLRPTLAAVPASFLRTLLS